MPDTYEEYKSNTTHFDPYFTTCPNDNELADSLDDHDLDNLSQIDHSEINAHGDLPALIISSSADSYDDQDLDSVHSENVLERPNRVRFRSRVRITSGLNRHRHKLEPQHQNQSEIDYLAFSPASSVSGSPSSSISVPLRTHTDEQVGKPGWGTLGQRVSLFARGKIERQKIREQRERFGLGASSFRHGVQRGQFGGGRPPYFDTDEVNERTPLLSPLGRRHPIYEANDYRGSAEVNQITRETEVSGPKPDRLANNHWWWQVEPIICCCCPTDSDDG